MSEQASKEADRLFRYAIIFLLEFVRVFDSIKDVILHFTLTVTQLVTISFSLLFLLKDEKIYPDL